MRTSSEISIDKQKNTVFLTFGIEKIEYRADELFKFIHELSQAYTKIGPLKYGTKVKLSIPDGGEYEYDYYSEDGIVEPGAKMKKINGAVGVLIEDANDTDSSGLIGVHFLNTPYRRKYYNVFLKHLRKVED